MNKVINKILNIIAKIVVQLENKKNINKVINKPTFLVDFYTAKKLNELNYDSIVTDYVFVDKGENITPCLLNKKELDNLNNLNNYKIYQVPTILDVIEWIWKKYGIKIEFSYEDRSYIISSTKNKNIKGKGYMIPENTPISKTLLSGIVEVINYYILKYK